MTFLPFLSHLSIVGFLGILAAAALSDVRNLTIPNRYCVAIALLYPAYLLSAGQPVDWLGALVVAGSMLAAGFVLFALRALGGGDAKLLAAVSLWAGPGLLPEFAILTALSGGGNGGGTTASGSVGADAPFAWRPSQISSQSGRLTPAVTSQSPARVKAE
jgi:prepilin signal peptidase PulO-like enzyme (type II secretory pathway)